MSPELNAVMERAPVRTITERRQIKADDAKLHQAEYTKYARRFILSGALATIVGAMVLLGSGLGASESVNAALVEQINAEAGPSLAKVKAWLSQPFVRYGLYLIEIAALGVAGFYGHLLSKGRPAEKWMNARKAAEALRVTRWETILKEAQELDKGTDALVHEQAAFEEFITDQLQKQKDYHIDKARTMSVESKFQLKFGAGIAAVVGLTAGAAFGGDVGMTVGAFIGVIAPILMAALNQWSDMNLADEKIIASKKMVDKLIDLMGELDKAKAGFATKDPSAARAIVAGAHEAMRDENEDWLGTKVPT